MRICRQRLTDLLRTRIYQRNIIKEKRGSDAESGGSAQAADHAAVHDAAAARDGNERAAARHVTRRRAHDRQHLAGFCDARSGSSDVSVDTTWGSNEHVMLLSWWQRTHQRLRRCPHAGQSMLRLASRLHLHTQNLYQYCKPAACFVSPPARSPSCPMRWLIFSSKKSAKSGLSEARNWREGYLPRMLQKCSGGGASRTLRPAGCP